MLILLLCLLVTSVSAMDNSQCSSGSEESIEEQSYNVHEEIAVFHHVYNALDKEPSEENLIRYLELCTQASNQALGEAARLEACQELDKAQKQRIIAQFYSVQIEQVLKALGEQGLIRRAERHEEDDDVMQGSPLIRHDGCRSLNELRESQRSATSSPVTAGGDGSQDN